MSDCPKCFEPIYSCACNMVDEPNEEEGFPYKQLHEQQQIISALQQENERYEKALQKIEHGDDTAPELMRREAKQALRGDENG